MPDGNEQAAYGKCGSLPGRRVLQFNALDDVPSKDVNNRSVPKHFNIWQSEHTLLHGLAGPQFIATMNDVHPGAELRQVGRFLHRRIAAADHGQFLITKDRKRAIAHRACADAAAGLGQPQFVLQADPVRRRAGGNNHGMGADLAAVRCLQREWPR